MKDRQTILVYVPKAVRVKLQKEANEEGISLSAVCRRYLTRAVEQE